MEIEAAVRIFKHFKMAYSDEQDGSRPVISVLRKQRQEGQRSRPVSAVFSLKKVKPNKIKIKSILTSLLMTILLYNLIFL